jgi:cell division septation protein DedD
MECRRDQRIPVNLNAALLEGNAMPRGCRVRDFNSRGMLLEYERDSDVAGFDHGDAVTVRLSLRHDEEREVITLPSTVRRVEANGIGVEFLRPEERLLRLLEPYRVEASRAQEASVADDETEIASAAGRPGSRGRLTASRRQASDSGGPPRHAGTGLAGAFRATRRIAGPRPAAIGSLQKNAGPGVTNRRLFYLGLVSLLFAAFLLVFDLAETVAIKKRLQRLEMTARDHAQALNEAPGTFRDAGAADYTGVAKLNERVEDLRLSLAALETRLMVPRPEREVAEPGRTPDAPGAEPGAPVERVETSDAATPVQPAVAANAAETGEGGPWVINLASSSSESAAQQFADQAAAKGVAVEHKRARVKGKAVWRLQVTGFASRQEARSYAELASNKLGLNGVWVFRR